MKDASNRPFPADSSERIEVLDVLRGLAIFGILPVNMLFFAGPLEWVAAPPWRGAADVVAMFLIHFFFSAKFYSIFSLLFGVGVALQVERLGRANQSVKTIHRRLAVLLVIGYLHIGLVWYGDILHWYAILGLLLLQFRERDASELVPPAIASFVLPIAILITSLVISSIDPSPNEGLSASWTEARSIVAYQSGNLGEVASQRWRDYLAIESGAVVFVPHVFSMFLIGMALGKLGVFSDVAKHEGSFRKALSWGLLLGVPINLVWVVGWFRADPNAVTPQMALVTSLRFLGGAAFAAAYVSSIVLVHRRTGGRRFWNAFANVGRTSLSNYLLQSVLCVAFFYGLGLFGRRGPAFGLFLTLSIYALQMLLSWLWLRRFKQGPAEWLWRRATYGA